MSRVLRSLLVAIVSLALFIGACASPPDRLALDALKTIKASAVAAMTVAGSLYDQGFLPEAQKAQAIDLYTKIEAGTKTAAASLSIVITAKDAADVLAPLQQLVAQLEALVAAFQSKKTSWWAPGSFVISPQEAICSLAP